MPTRSIQKRTAAPPNTGKEGVVFLSSTGQPYKDPVINSKSLKAYSKNFYGAGTARKLLALYFGDKLNIEVTNPTGEQDEDLEKEITQMISAPEVKFFSKMKIGWLDRFWQGMGFFNPVWELEGTTWKLSMLRRLPPESFSFSASDVSLVTIGENAAVPGEILKGVVAMPDGTIRYFQTGNNGIQTELKQIYVVKDSTSTDPAGEPEILPVTPVLTMLDFAWKSQMQKENRVGAPILLLKITNPKGDDVAYGAKLIKNWGSDTGFILRSNMEIVDFNPSDTATALETINKLSEMILDYWVPTNFLSKNGQLIGGNSNSDLSLLYSHIAGIHREIEAEWEPLLQIYLDANGYEGYRIKITIPDPEIDDALLKIEQAKVGADTGLLTDNEVRLRLGAPEMTPEELEELPARKKEAQAQEAARLQAEALKARTQDPNQDNQDQVGRGSQGGQREAQGNEQDEPETQDQVEGGGAQKGSKKGTKQLKQSRQAEDHAGEQDPDPTLSKIIDEEEASLNHALDALAAAVIAKL